ncbi:MAG: thymidine phosphorylase [bacterium]|nr:thymidine phosphorylase [bacterium]
MNVYDILHKKRWNKKLSDKEIDFMIKKFYYSEIPDYQMAAFLTSIAINSLTEEETFYFTKSIIETGQIMDYSRVPGIKLDKHSTGGVGDTVSLIAIPILATFNIKLPKLSGRALGHTGGTIDKLESIPNFNVNLNKEEMIDSLNKVGAFIALPLDLASADKKIYALRDLTANVDSIPLIASSIMSKKIAANSDIIVLDVKYGNGAFMTDYESAINLSKTMLKIGKYFNKVIGIIISDMNEMLNSYIGNYLEVVSAISFLKGNYNNFNKLKYVILSICSLSLYLYENYEQLQNNKELKEINIQELLDRYETKIIKKIDSLEPLNKFKEIIENQKGDSSIINDEYKYFTPKVIFDYYSKVEGYIDFIDTYNLGLAAGILGLSRKTKEDVIDNNSGIIMYKRLGDYVKSGEKLMTLFSKDQQSLEEALKIIENSIKIQKNYSNSIKYIYNSFFI